MNEQRDARLLIAEDETNLRLVLQKELQRLGYRVQAAADGEAALRQKIGFVDGLIVRGGRRAGQKSDHPKEFLRVSHASWAV